MSSGERMDFLNIYLISIASISFGYILAELLNQTNLINLIGKKTSKISKIGIHPLLSTIPALYLVSPRLAHTTASSLLKNNVINEFDLFIAVLASNFPLRLMYVYKYYLPVLVPLLGVVALYFIGLRIIFDIILLFVVMIVGRKNYANINNTNTYDNNNMNNNNTANNNDINIIFSKEIIKNGLIKGLNSSLNFAKTFTPVFLIVVFLIKFGIMDKLSIVMTPILKHLGLDSMGITYITTAILTPRVAYGMANVMLGYNYSIMTVLGCMFIGNGLFVLVYEWWSRLLPYYYGLYPKKTALKLIFIQAFMPASYNLLLGILLLKI